MAHWLLYALLAGTVFFFALNGTDSTLPKSAWLLWISMALVCVAAYRVLAGGGVRIEMGPGHLFVGLYLLASLASAFSAVNTRLALDALMMLGGCVVVFAATYILVDSPDEIRRLLGVLYALIGISCVAGIALRFFSPSVFSIMERSGRDMVSTFGNASYFAGFLAAGIPLVLGKTLEPSLKPPRRVGFAALLCLALYVMAETGTRSAWIGAAVGVVLSFLLNFRSSRRRIMVLVAAACVAFAALVVSSDSVRKRVSTTFDMHPSSTLARRIFFFEGAWNSFLVSPVVGNGVGSVPVVVPRYRSPEYWVYRSEDVVPHVHNEVLEILAEAGVAGFFPWILLVSYVSVVTLRRPPPEAGGGSRPNVLAIWCALVAILVDNMGSMSLRTVPVAVLFWMFLAILSRNRTDGRFIAEIMARATLRPLRFVPLILLAAGTVLLLQREKDRLAADRLALEGNLLHFLQRSPEAIVKFQHALSLDPYHEQARFNLASALLEHGRFAEAGERARSLLAEYPWYPKAHLISAAAAGELGDTARAMDHYTEELKLRSHPEAYYFMSRMYRRMSQDREELRTVEIMLRQSLLGSEGGFLGYGLSRIEALCRAERGCDTSLLNDVGERFPSDLNVLLAVGDCFAGMGLTENALDWYARAGTIDPANRAVAERMNRVKEMSSIGNARRR